MLKDLNFEFLFEYNIIDGNGWVLKNIKQFLNNFSLLYIEIILSHCGKVYMWIKLSSAQSPNKLRSVLIDIEFIEYPLWLDIVFNNFILLFWISRISNIVKVPLLFPEIIYFSSWLISKEVINPLFK